MSSFRWKCRSCREPGLLDVISLGCMPLANGLLAPEQLTAPEASYPLDLVFCPRCTLVQIIESVSPEKLFREYFYLSSFSDTLLRHAEEVTTQLTKRRSLDKHSLVIEVASNDGYLLQFYKREGIPVLGIEPARNIARVAVEKHGIPTICDFFDERLAACLLSRG